MKLKLLFLLASAMQIAHAGVGPSLSKSEFCADRSNNLRTETFVRDLTQSSENLMAFRNQGGLINGGVCWWHSRFQRNALYLTIYNPSGETPSLAEREELVKKIRKGNEVLTINGYANFNEFSRANASLIQRELEKWQKSDGITKFNWVIGLKGKPVAGAERFKKEMDELYQYVNVEGNIAYQKLQIKGIMAHAWLVVNMEKTSDGYDLEVIDSNFPSRTSSIRYKEGMESFATYEYGEFTPYTERKRELVKVKETVNKFCNN